MNCCNDTGTCTQGRDCPIRKQRAEETNKAYINQNNGLEPDLLDDVAQTFKALIAVIVVVTGIALLAIAIWGK
tara:strand:- start:699 stop:917 length:219 start_codon:yes stop_codon:yes gene_type:complete